MECVMCACKEPLRKMDQAASSLGTDELKRRIKTLSKKIKRKKRESEMLKSEIMLKKKDLSQSQGLVSDELYRPHIICTVVEKVVCEEAEEADGACVEHFHDRRKGLILDVKDYMTFFTPSSGLVDIEEVDVGDEVAVKSPLYPIIEKLPRYFPVEAQAMEVQELHGETFDKISGYEKQILELKEAVILPLEKRHLFAKIGIQPAKGVLLHGPPGTGKTSMAHACASLARCTFFRVPGAQLVGRYLAEGAQLIRDVFEIAKNKTPAIIFIDDIDAIGVTRTCNDDASDREAGLSLLQLLSHMDGFFTSDGIMVIGATNQVESLDPALVRSGRFDKKIEVPFPGHRERVAILMQYSRKLVMRDVNLDEVAKELENYSGAHCRAVCMEAGMVTLRRNGDSVIHDDFVKAIEEVRVRKKIVNYFA